MKAVPPFKWYRTSTPPDPYLKMLLTFAGFGLPGGQHLPWGGQRVLAPVLKPWDDPGAWTCGPGAARTQDLLSVQPGLLVKAGCPEASHEFRPDVCSRNLNVGSVAAAPSQDPGLSSGFQLERVP